MSGSSLISPSKSATSLKDKLKTLLHLHKESDLVCAEFLIQNGQGSGFFIKPPVLKTLGPDSQPAERLKMIRDLKNIIPLKRLEEGAIETLWLHIQDLLFGQKDDPENLARKEIIDFLIVICKNQFHQISLCRLEFFEALKKLAPNDDLGQNLALLRALTNNGEVTDEFDFKLFSLLEIYMERLMAPFSTPPPSPNSTVPKNKPQKTEKEMNLDFLDLLEIFVKLHSPVCFDKEQVKKLLNFVCTFACKTTENEEILHCITIINAVFCYSFWTKDSLKILVTSLAKLANSGPILCPEVWRTARNLLGTHYGYSALNVICGILQQAETYPDHSVIRGFIFFIGMSLWGAQRVESLRNTPSSVLPFFLEALKCNNSIVTLEVLLTCQRLIQKYGRYLQMITWDLIIQIFERIQQSPILDSQLNSDQRILTVFHDLLTNIENYCEDNVFSGSMEQFYGVVEKCMYQRSENSARRLMNYRLQGACPTKSDWLDNLKHLTEIFYKNERRSTIRVRLIEILDEFFDEFSYVFAEEMIDHVHLHTLSGFYNESDVQVQTAVINLLLNICRTSRKDTFYQLISLLEKFVVHSLENNANLSPRGSVSDPKDTSSTVSSTTSNMNLDNIHHCVVGLIQIAKKKWNSDPGDECLRVLNVLYKHICASYEKTAIFLPAFEARLAILKFFGSFKADLKTNRLIFVDEQTKNNVESCFICCTDYSDDHMLSYYTCKEQMDAFIRCLNYELHYAVFSEFCKILPNFLLSRTFLLTECDLLCQLCQNLLEFCQNAQNRAPKMVQAPDKLSPNELNELIQPSLCALVSYCLYFDEDLEKNLATTIQSREISQNPVCVLVGTIICIFEMPDVMTPMMSEFIARLSRLPHTPTLAIPTFEFLSTLMRMPNLYSEFTIVQYEHVYSIMLPYTNPFRFTEVIVSVAYHVIFKFFLRIPIKFRPRIAKHALKLSSMVDIEMKTDELSIDKLQQKELSEKFSSLNEMARKIFVLFLSHFSFKNESSNQKRSQFAKILFKKGQTQYFLMGDNIFSVTMNKADYDQSNFGPAGQSKSAENGQDSINQYCSKCIKAFTQYKRHKSQVISGEEMQQSIFTEEMKMARLEKSAGDDIQSSRRRYKSAIQKSVTKSEHRHLPLLSLDDSFIDRPRNRSAPFGKQQELKMVEESVNVKKPFLSAPPLRPCICWCRGFVEIGVRHPFGQCYWIVRGQENDQKKSRDDSWLNENPDSELFYSIIGTRLRVNEMAKNRLEDLVTVDVQTDMDDQTRVTPIQPCESQLGYVMNFDPELRPPENVVPEIPDVTSWLEKSPEQPAIDHLNLVSIPTEELLESYSPNLNTPGSTTISTSVEDQSPPKSDSTKSSETPTEQIVDNDEIRYFLLQLFNFCLPPGANWYNFSAFSDPLSAPEGATSSENKSNIGTSVFHLPANEATFRSFKILDKIRPQEAQKVGVLYVGPGQTKEKEILGNRCGSERYEKFLSGLGKAICLKDVDQFETFLGGLAQDGNDGEFAYYWSDQVAQLIFHVGTLMPNKESDPHFCNKQRHIGNNHVTIIFNESGLDYKLSTISGQLSYVAIVVEPLDNTTLRVTLKAKDEISKWLALKEVVLSDEKMPLLCRQMAMRAEVSARIWLSCSLKYEIYLCRSIERLKQIRHIREKYRGKAFSFETVFD